MGICATVPKLEKGDISVFLDIFGANTLKVPCPATYYKEDKGFNPRMEATAQLARLE